METNAAMQAYYDRDRERDRLAAGVGRLEFERTVEIINRTLPNAPATVADIGGGPGRYTDWLIDAGYSVIHRDVVVDHVEQLKARHQDGVDTAVGDARALDLADAHVDAVLLLGPLYHLVDPDDRAMAIAEAARVTRPGGFVYAAGIGRWSARLGGAILSRQYLEFPEVAEVLNDVDSNGFLPAIFEGAFTGFAHTPDQLRSEMSHDTLHVESLVAIEGPASLLSEQDIDERLADENDREMLYDSLRALESIPDLLGVSNHLLATARRLSAATG